jgi:O-antigen/teichoic acid export membrane protein
MLFLSSFNMVFAPMIADLANRKEFDLLQTTYQTATRWFLSLALPFFVGLALLAHPILSLFGPEFVAGSSTLAVLAAGQIIAVGVGSVGYLVAMSGHPQMIFWNRLAGLLLNIALTLLLLPRFGLLGAAIAQAIMIAFVNILALVEVRFLLKIQPYTKSYAKPLIAISGAGAATFVSLYVPGMFGLPEIASGLSQIGLGCLILVIAYLGLLSVQGLEQEDRRVLMGLAKGFSDRWLRPSAAFAAGQRRNLDKQ